MQVTIGSIGRQGYAMERGKAPKPVKGVSFGAHRGKAIEEAILAIKLLLVTWLIVIGVFIG